MSIPPRGRARPAWATPWLRLAPSARGRGARARWWRSCDQRVVAGQRSGLDRELGRLVAAFGWGGGVLDRGDRAVASEHSRVRGGGFARVQQNRRDRGLGDADLDAPAREARVQRVVVG